MKFINKPKKLIVSQKDNVIFLDWLLIERAILLFCKQNMILYLF